MITGLFANALGWRRVEHRKHDRLQDRLVFGARLDRRPCERIVDLQNARLRMNDQGWTSRGARSSRKDPRHPPSLDSLGRRATCFDLD